MSEGLMENGELKVENGGSAWREVRLGDVADVRDGTHDSPKQSSKGKYLITSRHLKNGQIDFSSAYKISINDYESVNRRSKVDKYDVLFSMIGTIGEMTIVDFEPDFAIKNIGLFKTNKNKELAKWIYYYFKSNEAKAELDASLKGSTQQYITLGDLRKFPISLPPLPEQKAIAEVLSALDDKIDLLHRQNKNLEKMAETLFRQWFVVEADEDWGEGVLGDFFDVKTGKKNSNYGTEDGQYPFFTCSQKSKLAPDYSFDGDAILLAGNGDFNIKRYSGKFEAYQRTYVLMPHDKKYFGFLYALMKYFLSEITSGHQGSVINFITKGMIENFSVRLPKESQNMDHIFKEYNEMFEKVDSNQTQIRTLQSLRDTLLPKLMSGEVRIASNG